MKKNKIGRGHYLLLVMGLCLSMTVILLVRQEKALQIASAAWFGLFYVVWGVIYHRDRGDFTVRLFWEYFSFALLGVGILLILLLKI